MGIILTSPPPPLRSFSGFIIYSSENGAAYDVSALETATYAKFVIEATSNFSSGGAGDAIQIMKAGAEVARADGAGNCAASISCQKTLVRGTDYNSGDTFQITFPLTTGGGTSNTFKGAKITGVFL
jgi:hypothetical protein